MATGHHSPPSPSHSARPPKIVKMEDALDITQATTAITIASSRSTPTPIPSGRPDAKARRYDRQLRLWASAGQRSLESARILLVGHDAPGCQALKNLVLPGIQHFTIMSDAKTEAADVGTNFFLEPSSVGKPIAEEEVRLLRELNPAVSGAARIANAERVLENEPNFFLTYTLIITSNVDPKFEDRLADLLWQTSATVGSPDIPLLSIRSSGLTGRIQIQLREHCIVDTHPDTTHTLRIDQPFPALENYARSIDLASLDSMDHSHIPWVILLVRAISLWKESHDGKVPETQEEKAEFKKALSGERIKSDEENFDEALGQAYRAWSSSELSWDITDLFKEPSVANVHHGSKNVHLLLHTLQRFIDNDPLHLPPVSPSLPDMHSSTTTYVAVQNLYRTKFQEDLAKFTEILQATLKSVGLPIDAVPVAEIESFVKNVGGVAIIKGSPLQDAKQLQGAILERLPEGFPEPGIPMDDISVIVAILASEQFHDKAGRWPGSVPGPIETDVAEVERLATEAIKSALVDSDDLPPQLSDAIGEVVRGGFLTPPTTAAFIGGIVGQEVIKLVTNQYQPLDNTASVDLVSSRIDKFKL